MHAEVREKARAEATLRPHWPRPKKRRPPPDRAPPRLTREVGIGIAGYGMMGKAHAYAYTVAPVMRTLPCRPRLRVVSGRDEDRVSRAAAAYGFEHWVGDWRELVKRSDVDIVDICTPPGTHAEIAAAA